jgi:hypothetical protein
MNAFTGMAPLNPFRFKKINRTGQDRKKYA